METKSIRCHSTAESDDSDGDVPETSRNAGRNLEGDFRRKGTGAAVGQGSTTLSGDTTAIASVPQQQDKGKGPEGGDGRFPTPVSAGERGSDVVAEQGQTDLETASPTVHGGPEDEEEGDADLTAVLGSLHDLPAEAEAELEDEMAEGVVEEQEGDALVDELSDATCIDGEWSTKLLEPERSLFASMACTAVSDGLTARLQAVEQVSTPASDSSAELWEATCALFKHPRLATDQAFDLPWLNDTRLTESQACSVTRMALRSETMRGGILANKVGLGKTLVVWALIRLNSILDIMHHHVKGSRAGCEGVRTEPAPRARPGHAGGFVTADGRHLREGAPPGSKCPSGQRADWPVQCVCEADGVSARISVVPGCVQVIVPTVMKSHWAKELDRVNRPIGTIDTPESFFRHLSVMVGHSDNVGLPKFHDKIGNVLQHRSLRTLYVVITTPQSLYRQVTKVIEDYAPAKASFAIKFGLNIVDEVQRHEQKSSWFYNSILHMNDPRRFKAGIRHDPVFWLVTGTPCPGGPKHLMAMVQLFRALWDQRPAADANVAYTRSALNLPSLRSIQRTLNRARRLYLEDAAPTGESPSRGAASDEMADALRSWATLLGALTIQKGEQTLSVNSQLDDHGELVPQPLVTLPALHQYVIPTRTQGYEDSLRDYIARISMKIATMRSDSRKKSGQAAVHARRAAFLSEATWRITRKFIMTFPAARRLLETGKLGSRHLLGTVINQQQWFSAAKESVYTRYAAEFFSSSSKAQALVAKLKSAIEEDQARDLARAQSRRKSGRPDPYKKSCEEDRETQSLILTRSPASAVCLYHIILQSVPGLTSAHVALITSSTPPAARDSIIRGFQKEVRRRPDGRILRDAAGKLLYEEPIRPTVLISTVAILGAGVNLSNATWTHLLEPQTSRSIFTQASARGRRMNSEVESSVFTYLNLDFGRETLDLANCGFDELQETDLAAYKVGNLG